MNGEDLPDRWAREHGGRPVEDHPRLAGDLTSALARWLAEARVDEATGARSREHWLTQMAAEETTFASVLTDLSDRGRPVLLHTRVGRSHRGHIVVLGRDFVALRLDSAAQVLIRLDGVSAVRTQPGEHPAHSGRAVHLDLLFVDAVTAMAEDRPRVRMIVEPSETVSGELRSVGQDVATVEVDGGSRANVYVPLRALVELGVAI